VGVEVGADGGSAARAPLVISGIGGSGTRVFARVLRHAGIHLGTRLNRAEDALEFRHFGRRWVGRYLESERARALSAEETEEMRAELEACVARHRSALDDGAAPWGWKQPRSIHFLPLLRSLYPGLRFLHVLRDGRDVAFGKPNPVVWVGDYVLGPDRVEEPIPLRMMRLWAAANSRAADYGERHLGAAYAAVKLEELCAEPQATVERLLRFTLPDRSVRVSDEMLAEVQTPRTIGRWRKRDAELVARIEAAGVDALERFGYAPDEARRS
jgi:Sulfotransferase family